MSKITGGGKCRADTIAQRSDCLDESYTWESPQRKNLKQKAEAHEENS